MKYTYDCNYKHRDFHDFMMLRFHLLETLTLEAEGDKLAVVSSTLTSRC